MNLETCRKRANKMLLEYDYAKRQVKEEKTSLQIAEQVVKDAEQAQGIIQNLAQEIQQKTHHRISSVVSRCLETIFQENAYQFRMDFIRLRGKTEARIVFVRDGKEIEPTEAASGGAIDIAAFALRVACLMLHRPPLRRILIADEPYRNLNGEVYQERMGDMLLTLAREMGIQMVICSDDLWLKIGKVIEL